MLPKAHLFVVDDDTLPVHVQNGFCGIVKTQRENRAGGLNISYFGQQADLMNIHVGDLAFFYMITKAKDRKLFEFAHDDEFEPLQQGYYGVYRITGQPFISEGQVQGQYPFENYYIFGSVSNIKYRDFVKQGSSRGVERQFRPPVLSIRIPIAPVDDFEKFENRFVDDNQAYIDKTDEGILGTLMFKKIQRAGEERSITPILPEEASKIARLIFKQPKRNFGLAPIDQPSNQHGRPVELDLEEGANGELKLEMMLEAYILRCLNEDTPLGALDATLGNRDSIEYCGNQVQYGISGNKVDILLLHRSSLAGSTGYRHQATVIELKKSKIMKEDVQQILDYRKWIAQLTTHNNLSAIKPILIGKKPSSRMTTASKKDIRDALTNIKRFGISEPEFIEYKPLKDKDGRVNSIVFEKFDIHELIDDEE
jgi:hypothetical protein